MKTGSIPYPRTFGPGADGYDCRAVKRAVAAFFTNPAGMDLKSNTFAKPAQTALAHFKGYVGLVDDPVYTIEAHEKLLGSFDAFGASLMNEEVKVLASAAQRGAFTGTLEWMIAHAHLFAYREIRPIPENLAPFETTELIVTDCSGTIEVAADWSKLPDPSGLAYNGQGNTGTLLKACVWITQAEALPADLVVSRSGPEDEYGNHAFAILAPIGNNTDFDCFSNGYIDDPLAHTFSNVMEAEAGLGYPDAQFLRWLPAP